MITDDPVSVSSFMDLLDAPRKPDANFIEFYVDAVHNKIKSDEAGRPIFDSKEFIRITSPGAKSVVERPITDADKRKYAHIYLRWQKGEETPLDGTPVKEWSYLSVSQIKELKAQNIHTVEQIVALPDSHISNLGLYGMELRAKAKDFISKAEKNAPILQLREENEKLKVELEELKTQMAQAVKTIDSLKPKKRYLSEEINPNGTHS